MFIKNILKGFERNTKIEVYCMDRQLGLWTLVDDYTTVGKFMDSGLMTYTTIDEDSLLEVDDNKILIYMK